MCQESFKCVSKKIERYFEGALRIFQVRFKCISKKLIGCYEDVSNVFQGGCKGDSITF